MRIVQQNSGRRPQPMPGARMLWIVAMKLTAPSIEDRPTMCRAMIHASWPACGVYSPSESGGGEGQPPPGGGEKKEGERKKPPEKKKQQEPPLMGGGGKWRGA